MINKKSKSLFTLIPHLEIFLAKLAKEFLEFFLAEACCPVSPDSLRRKERRERIKFSFLIPPYSFLIPHSSLLTPTFHVIFSL